MKIAFDLDDTIVDLNTGLILFHNERYGTNLRREDFYIYSYWKIWGGSRDEAIRKVQEFLNSDYYRSILPISGAKEALLDLKEAGHELAIVTGRDIRMAGVTSELVDRHFVGIFSDIFYANSFVDNGATVKKSIICQRWGARTIIEDDPMHIVDCLEAGMKVLVPETPWNKDDFPAGATRLLAWKDIAKEIA